MRALASSSILAAYLHKRANMNMKDALIGWKPKTATSKPRLMIGKKNSDGETEAKVPPWRVVYEPGQAVLMDAGWRFRGSVVDFLGGRGDLRYMV